MSGAGNLKVMGDSAIGGGTYDRVSVVGNLTVSEDITAKKISVTGVLEAEGDLFCEELSIMGTAKCRKLSVREGASIMGEVTACDIAAEELVIRGAVRAENGIFAEKLTIKSKYKSEAKELGGRQLLVKPPLFFSGIALTAETIEFDEVEIDCVEAKVVRGKRIQIGEHCKIEKVERI